MARRKDQGDKRAAVIAAAEALIAKNGLQGTTLDAIAKAAGMTSNALLYYYSGFKDVIDDVQKRAVDRFCDVRAEGVAHLADMRQRLWLMMDSGLPSGPEDELCRLLYEVGCYARSDGVCAARYLLLFERQVTNYVAILEAGAAMGAFRLKQPCLHIARQLVVLEDGLGLHMLNLVPAINRSMAFAMMRGYAELATDCKLVAPEETAI